MNSPLETPAMNAEQEEEQKEHPFQGELVFEKNTIRFKGRVIAIRNISMYDKYIQVPRKKVSTIRYIFSAIASVAGIIGAFVFPLFLLVTLYYVPIVYKAYKERQKPTLYGLTISLNNGYRFYFSSKDKFGIGQLHQFIANLINADVPVNHTFNFSGDTITNYGDGNTTLSRSRIGGDWNT